MYGKKKKLKIKIQKGRVKSPGIKIGGIHKDLPRQVVESLELTYF